MAAISVLPDYSITQNSSQVLILLPRDLELTTHDSQMRHALVTSQVDQGCLLCGLKLAGVEIEDNWRDTKGLTVSHTNLTLCVAIKVLRCALDGFFLAPLSILKFD
jgi:hypothetical protein